MCSLCLSYPTKGSALDRGRHGVPLSEKLDHPLATKLEQIVNDLMDALGTRCSSIHTKIWGGRGLRGRESAQNVVSKPASTHADLNFI